MFASKHLAALAVFLGISASLAAQGLNFFAIDPEKLDDMKALAKAALPSPQEMGPDWRSPWNLPVPGGKYAKESDYWNSLLRELGPAGMKEADARTRLDTFAKMVATEMKKEGLGEREFLGAVLFALESQNAPTARKLDDSFRMIAELLPPPGSERPKNSKDGEKKILAAMLAPYKDLSEEQMKQSIVKQVTIATRRTRMKYVRSNNWDAAAANRSDKNLVEKGIWIGEVTVNLTVIDSTRTAEIIDLKPADAPALEARMNANLKKFAGTLVAQEVERYEADLKTNGEREKALETERATEQDAERRKQLTAAIDDVRKQRDELTRKRDQARASLEKIKLTVANRPKFGDNAYVVRIQGVAADTPGLNVGQYHGWIRNGNCLVEISFTGNFPEEMMIKEMDHFLAEMAAKSASFAN